MVDRYTKLVKLEDSLKLYSPIIAYGFLVSINDLIRAAEELKWGVGAAISDATQRKITVFEAMKAVINNGLLPNFKEAKTILDTKLK